MDLDEIIQDKRARRSMQEQDFLDEGAALEGKLVEVIGPAGMRRVPSVPSKSRCPFFNVNGVGRDAQSSASGKSVCHPSSRQTCLGVATTR